MNKKEIAIYQDQRIAEEFCNFRCEYCGGLCPVEYTIVRDKDGNLTVPESWHHMIDSMPDVVKSQFASGITFENFYKLAILIMEQSKEILDTDILKISGGELTLYDGLCEFVRAIHNNYPIIQILSNGYNLKEKDIVEYKKMGNICFQISIDGVDSKTNYSKSHSSFVTNAVLNNIKCLLKHEIPVEINCVLTKYNTDSFLQFLDYFSGSKSFVVVPRPVRGEAKNLIDFTKTQIDCFEKCIIENYDNFSSILPPKSYFIRVIDMMKTQKRNFPCYIPYFVQSIDGYGNYEMCPLGLAYTHIKNVLNNDITSLDVLLNSEYNEINSYEKCNYCMVQYEIFNLYVDDIIDENDLRRIPSLNNEVIISHIYDIKERIKMKKLEHVLIQDYGLKNVVITRSEESTDGNVYIVDSSDCKCVVKIYASLDHTNSMIKLHNDLIQNNVSVPRIIKTTSGDSFAKLDCDKYIVVYSFISGIQVGEKYKNIPSDVVRKIAQSLKEFHDITSNENKYNLKGIPFKVESDISRESALHFDLTRNNIFCDDSGQEISFIDFDDAKYGKSICDVAIAIANMFFSKTRGIDSEGLKTFIEAYYEGNDDLKEKELEYIKAYAITWIDYVMAGNEFDSSTVESFDVRKNLLEEYFK